MALDQQHHKKLNLQLRDLLAMIRTSAQPGCIRDRARNILEAYAPQEGDGPDALNTKWLIRPGWQSFWEEHGNVASAWVSFSYLPPMDHDHRQTSSALVEVLRQMVRVGIEDVRFDDLKEKLAKYLRHEGFKDGEVNETPRWDGTTLWLGENPVKRYRRGDAAKNCKEALDEFQQRGWPPDVPSLFGKDAEGQKKLADTLRHMNNGQKGPVRIRFFPKKGIAIGWELRRE